MGEMYQVIEADFTCEDEEINEAYLVFRLGDDEFAVSVSSTVMIAAIERITPIPGAQPYIAGAADLNGELLTVCDTRVLFGLPAQLYSRPSCIIVIESAFGRCGMIVDGVCDVESIAQSDISIPGNTRDKFVRGISSNEGHLRVILDCESIIRQSASAKSDGCENPFAKIRSCL